MRRAAAAMKRAEALRASRAPQPPTRRKPPREEGGEPMPALPKPKPKPLAGGAAVPIEKSFRLKKSVSGKRQSKRVLADSLTDGGLRLSA